MEKWSTVENAGDQDIKHRAMISILVAILQVTRSLNIFFYTPNLFINK